jgi:ABC-type nickel/cobalt efflux system permease component RcnA
MFGLDTQLAGLSDGTTLAFVLLAATLLGLRHASDPDHLAAVTTLVAGRREGSVRRAARLGLAWGAGHATSLFAFGVPVVLYRAYLPERVQAGAETLVGVLIVALGAWLLVRWRRGAFLAHAHDPEHAAHVHGRGHGHAGARTHTGRSPLQAYGIGLVHGMGGTAGIGVLLLAAIDGRALALGSLAVFAVCTAVSMATLSAGLGLTLGTRLVRSAFQRLVPAMGLVSTAFGVWYALGAQGVVPYVF